MVSSARRGPGFAVDLLDHGDSPALVAGREVVTYRRLAELADEFADQLDPRVRLLAVQARNELAPIIAYLGALRRGVPVILHGGGPVQDMLARFRPEGSFTFDESAGAWRLDKASAACEDPPHPELAVLLSTSGSTGSSKLVRLSASNLQANAQAIADYLELGPGERAITTLPFSYSYGLSVLNSHLSSGGSVVLTEVSVATPAFCELVIQHEVTSLAGVPYSYELMERSGLLAALPPTVRTLTQAGGRMAPEMITRVANSVRASGARLFVMYGQTEATARIAYLPPGLLDEYAGCVGGPIPGGELWVEDPAGQRLSLGEEGSLTYRGPSVMMGYASSRSDMRLPPGPDTLQTGDLAREVAPGIYRITGRLSRFVKPLGLRVSLDEIEARCGKVGADALATGDDELVVVASTPAASDAVRESVLGLGLPESLFEFLSLDSIPRLPGGKPDYVQILRLGRERRSARPAGHGIESIEMLFRRIARRDSLPDDSSFDALGGDSLNYVQGSIVIESALGFLPHAWEQMTLNDFRTLAARRGAVTPRKLQAIEPDIIVRALAILLILFNHAVGNAAGGSDILMVLAGFTWARFQRKRLIDGKSRGVFKDFFRKYILIYIAVILFVSMLNKTLSISHLLFHSTFLGDWGGILNTYWFMESLTWAVGFTCLAFSAPWIRSVARTHPFASAVGFVGAALVVRLIGSLVSDPAAHAYRTPDQVLLYFAVGWSVALARDTATKVALLSMLVVASGLAWGWMDTHVISLSIASAALVGFKQISIPRRMSPSIILVASASFYIYLLNPIPIYFTDQILQAQHGPFWALQIGASILLGLMAYLALQGLSASALAKFPIGRDRTAAAANRRRP